MEFITSNHFFKIIFFSLIFCFRVLAVESEEVSKEVDIGFGIVNFSLAELPSTLTGENIDDEVANVTGSIPSLIFCYKVATSTTKSFYFKGVTPIASTDGNSILMGGGGLEFYIKSFSSKINFDDGLSQIEITPKYRFFWGVDLMFGNIIYTTETAKKSDVFFEIAAQGGFAYNFNKQWGVKTNLSFGQGIGVLSTTTLVKFFISASYFID